MNRIGVQTSNFSLITGMFRWLSYGEFPLSITRPAFKDTVLELTREGAADEFIIDMDIPCLVRFGRSGCLDEKEGWVK